MNIGITELLLIAVIVFLLFGTRKLRDIWREMQAVLSALESKGIPLSFEWVEAHAGCIGNSAADQLATVALFKARESRQSFDSDDIDFMVSEPENYWDAGGDTRHPLMNFRYCFLEIIPLDP